MDELIRSSFPFLVPALLPALLLLVAPLCGKRARTILGGALLVSGIGFVVDVLILDHTAVQTLDVKILYPYGPNGDGKVWIVDPQVQAPASHWHFVVAGTLAGLGLLLLARRGRAPAAPHPVAHVTLLLLVYLAFRIGLEKTAAPVGLVWATGVNFATLLAMPFFGWYAGRRGSTYGGFVKQVLLAGFLVRLAITVFGYFATTRAWGSHLDSHLVTGINLKPFGEKTFDGDAVQAWLYTTAIPQLTYGLLFFALGVGLVLGSVPFLIARKKRK